METWKAFLAAAKGRNIWLYVAGRDDAFELAASDVKIADNAIQWTDSDNETYWIPVASVLRGIISAPGE